MCFSGPFHLKFPRTAPELDDHQGAGLAALCAILQGYPMGTRGKGIFPAISARMWYSLFALNTAVVLCGSSEYFI